MSELRWPPNVYLDAVKARLREGGFGVRTHNGTLVARRQGRPAQEDILEITHHETFAEDDVQYLALNTYLRTNSDDAPPVVMAVAIVDDPHDDAVEAVQWFQHARGKAVPVIVDLRVGELHFPMEWMYAPHFDLVEGFLLPDELP